MAKLKTNSGAKKRFTLTGSGKIKRKHAYHSHILTKKTKKRGPAARRFSREPAVISCQGRMYGRLQKTPTRKV